MLKFEINSTIPLINPCKKGSIYKGITSDNCYFYLTLSDCCEIHKYNKCFKFMESVKTCRKYSYICYDTHLDCFWCVNSCGCNTLYKLDKCLNEICSCELIDKNISCITGIAYSKCCDQLMITTDRKIYNITKNGCICDIIKEAMCDEKYAGIDNIDKCYIY